MNTTSVKFTQADSWNDIESMIEDDYDTAIHRALEIKPSEFALKLNDEYHKAMQAVVDGYNTRNDYSRIKNKYMQAVVQRHGLELEEDIVVQNILKPGRFSISYEYITDNNETKKKTVSNLDLRLFMRLYEDLSTVTGKTFRGKEYKGRGFIVYYRSVPNDNRGSEFAYTGMHHTSNQSLADIRLEDFAAWGVDDDAAARAIEYIDTKYKRIKEYYLKEYYGRAKI